MATREEVYTAIDGERDYQDRKWGPPEVHHHSVTEFLVYIRDYVEEALHAETRSVGEPAKATHNMRKIGALAVACMEQNGVLYRNEES
jgi:hypothetical protein